MARFSRVAIVTHAAYIPNPFCTIPIIIQYLFISPEHSKGEDNNMASVHLSIMDSEILWEILKFPNFEYYPAGCAILEYGAAF